MEFMILAVGHTKVAVPLGQWIFEVLVKGGITSFFDNPIGSIFAAQKHGVI